MFLELLSYGIYGCRSWSWAFGIKVPELFQAKHRVPLQAGCVATAELSTAFNGTTWENYTWHP